MTISAYNCGLDAMTDLGVVSYEDARNLIDQRMPYAAHRFEEAEEAVAHTMFGFSRTDADFIEINLAGVGIYTVRHEPSREDKGFFARLTSPREYLVHLSTRAQLDQIVAAYFRSSADAAAIMKTYTNKALR